MNEVGKYRKKPVVVEAVRWPCDSGVLSGWDGLEWRPTHQSDMGEKWEIPENSIVVWNAGWRIVEEGHWIVKHPDDSFHVVAGYRFDDSYETPSCPICENIGCELPLGGSCWLPCPVCGKEDCGMMVPGGDCWITWVRDNPAFAEAPEDEDDWELGLVRTRSMTKEECEAGGGACRGNH